MSGVSLTKAQIGALHDLAVAFTACDIDVAPEAFHSIGATIYTPAPDRGRFTTAAFSISVAGTVRSRELATA